MVATLKREEATLRDLNAALRTTEAEEAALHERMAAHREKRETGLAYEDRVAAILGEAEHVTLEDQQVELANRRSELKRLIADGQKRKEFAEGALRRLRAESVKESWKDAVQAVVDALALVSEASREAETLRRQLDGEGLGRVHASVLDLFALADMPAARDPWGKVQSAKGLSIVNYLNRAESIGCDLSRVVPPTVKGKR